MIDGDGEVGITLGPDGKISQESKEQLLAIHGISPTLAVEQIGAFPSEEGEDMHSNPRRRLLTAKEAAILCGVQPATIRDWVRRKELAPAASYTRNHTNLFLEVDVLLAERRIRKRRA